MATDLDPLDEIFPDRVANGARAGGKFQPKAKARPRKEPSAPLASRQHVRNVDINNKLPPVVGPALGSSDTLEAEKLLKDNEDYVSGVHSNDDSALLNLSLDNVVIGECLDRDVDLHSDVVIPNLGGDWHSVTGKSLGESADIFFGLESLDDFYSQPASRAGARSPSKADLSGYVGNKFAMPSAGNDGSEGSLAHLETQSVLVSDDRCAEDEHLIPGVSPLDDSAARVSNASSLETCPEVNISRDSLNCREAVVSNSGGGSSKDYRRLETESQDAEDIPSLETSDDLYENTTQSGRQIGKFQPKPKFQANRDRPGTGTSSLDGLQSESDYLNEGSIPAVTLNDALDLSSWSFGNSTSHLAVKEKQTNLVENSQSDVFIPGETSATIPEILEKEHEKNSISGQDNEAIKSTRQLRKRRNACKLVDESEDETFDDENFTSEFPGGSLVDEDENENDGVEYQVTNETKNKRAPTKPKRSAPQKEKAVQKRKKANGVPEQASKEHPKKFSHSSRRKRRQVDKVLLETPEDEIDVRKLRIRDLILLAEHRERMSSKEGKTTGAPPTNQSAGNSFINHNEEDTFTSELGRGSSNDQTNPNVQESSTFTNYQSFMSKTPRSRWSKQDTELFYEGVKQFGSDISMIQQLFPGRTRDQVKFKYKKEERQHPLRLHEALTNRSKHHAHFQLVIERLQQIAAQEKQNSYKDDSNSCDEELNPEIYEEVSKSEQVEEEDEAVEPDVSHIQSPVKSYGSEDDLYRWSQYKSEL